MTNGNGYKVAFWVMTVIATIGMVLIINAVVGNDRLRQSGDSKLLECYNALQLTFNDSLHSIDIRLTRIEDKLGVAKNER
jgi:Ni/Fe-hydrogenase subunit HybB-like protein